MFSGETTSRLTESGVRGFKEKRYGRTPYLFCFPGYFYVWLVYFDFFAGCFAMMRLAILL